MKSVFGIVKQWDKSEEDDPENKEKISFFWSIFYAFIAILLYFLIYLNSVYLPTALTTQDETSFKSRFNAGVARQYLKEITDIGPRLGGSYENEVLTVEFLRKSIMKIITEANPVHKFEFEVQKGYGNVTMKEGAYQGLHVYRGIQNVVVKITPSNQIDEPDNYLLLNSHFDTKAETVGAGDDASKVAVMLEILRKLTRDDRTFRHGIVFLFNGFEENFVQASHAFVKGHRWMEKIRVVINLEAAASGGKDLMFQAGPKVPFLMTYFNRHTSNPLSNSVAEQAFQAGLIPSGTDFGVFVKYGNLSGFDIASYAWGYLYHTKYDNFDAISAESLQYSGDNILELTKGLADAEEMDDMEGQQGEKTIFFDFLNWFMVAYSSTIGIIIHSFMIIFAASTMIVSLMIIINFEGVSCMTVVTEVLISIVVQVMSIVIGTGIVMLLAVIFYDVGRSMSWFSSTWLIFGLFYIPFIISMCLGPLLYIKFRKLKYLNIQSRVNIFLQSTLFIHMALLIIITALGWQTSYLFSITTFCYSFTNLINIFWKFKNFHWIYVHVLGQMVPFLYYSALAIFIFATFISMTGRGAATNPDLLIGALSVFTGLMAFSFVTPLVSLMRQPFYFIGLLVVYFVINIIVMVTPVGFPYREAISPQRFYLTHMERNFYDIEGKLRKTDSKVYIESQDPHNPYTILDVIPELKDGEFLSDECDKELYCAIPYYLSSRHAKARNSYWLPFSKPKIPAPPINLSFVGKEEFLNRTKFNFKIKGIDHMGFYISPVEGCKLSKWSFGPKTPKTGPKWNGQEVFYVNYVYGIDDSESSFFIEIEHPSNRPPNTPSFIFAVAGLYMHHVEDRTGDFKAFISKFPKFAHVVAYISHYENRVY